MLCETSSSRLDSVLEKLILVSSRQHQGELPGYSLLGCCAANGAGRLSPVLIGSTEIFLTLLAGTFSFSIGVQKTKCNY